MSISIFQTPGLTFQSTEEDPFALFGKSRVVYAKQTSSKAARRARQLLELAQQRGILASDLHLTQSALTHTLTGNTFVEIRSEEEAKGWYVHPCLLLPRRADGGKHLIPSLSEASFDQKKQVITIGMCLFGASSVLAHTEDGNIYHLTDAFEMERLDSKIKRFSINHALHIYEIEALARLTHFLCKAFRPDLPLEIRFHPPRLEYWLFALGAYEAGYLEKDLFLQWLAEVDERARWISTLFAQMTPGAAIFHEVKPLDLIEEPLRLWILRGDRSLHKKILDLLMADSSWHALLLRVEERARNQRDGPQSRKHVSGKALSELNGIDLGQLSYVMTQIRALEKSAGSMIHLYGPEELPI